MTSRNWIGTLNNAHCDAARDWLELWKTVAGARYVCGQVEKGVLEGTPHI